MKYLMLLPLLILLSCKKPFNKNVVNVQAYNVLDGSGLDSVYVAVYKEPAGDLGNSKTVAEGYTDSDGNLKLIYSKFKLFKSFNLYDYYDDTYYKKIKMIINGTEWNGEGQTGAEKITDFEIQYAPFTNYKVHLKNVNCLNAYDTLFLDQIYIPTGEVTPVKNGIIGVGLINYAGCFDKLQADYIQIPAGNYQYLGRIVRDNGTTYIDTTIFVQPGIDNFIELFF